MNKSKQERYIWRQPDYWLAQGNINEDVDKLLQNNTKTLLKCEKSIITQMKKNFFFFTKFYLGQYI